MSRVILPLLAASVLVAGCYSTSITSGLEPNARPPIEFDEKWHSGVVLGMGEVSGPYRLDQICPNGWAKIQTHTSFPNGVAELFTSGIYSPQTISVTCAKRAAAPAPSSDAPPATPAPSPAPPPAPPSPAPPPAPPSPAPPPASPSPVVAPSGEPQPPAAPPPTADVQPPAP